MKLSIILPIYNTEKYLHRCLDSVFNQDLNASDYELIAVNDGSTDGCLAILKQYESKHANLVLIDQANAGDSEARNRGLKVANGKYITFLDSDDAIYENTLKTIIDRAEKEDLDILYLKMMRYDDDGNFLYETNNVGNDDVILPGFEHPRRTFPATLYRKTMLKDVFFDKEILLGTESVLNAIAQTRASKCSNSSLPFYKYTDRPNSISKKARTEKSYTGYLKGIINMRNFQKENYPNSNAIQTKYFNDFYFIFMTRIIEWSIIPEFNKSRFVEIKKLLNELDLNYVNDLMATKFPYFNKSFFQFSLYQKYLIFREKLYYILFPSKKKKA
jgi:poly(ribitol-phosphate) beta-N-acetylglucosaminyltransferase